MSGWTTQYAAIVRKETLQTLKDRRIVALLVMAPLIQTLLFGVAVDFDVDDVPTAVVDLDDTATSRRLVRGLLADGTLRASARARSAADVLEAIDVDEVKAALIVPAGFAARLQRGGPASAQLLLDGSDPVRGGTAGSAAARYFGAEGQAMAAVRGPAIEVEPRVLYNPSLRTQVYSVPGILAMLLVIVTTIVTAMGLSREREAGTLEQIMVTPIRPLVLLAGKMSPFLLIGLFDVLLVTTAMVWLFDIPVRGPLVVLFVGTLFYLCTTLGVGLFVSTVSSTQQQAFLGSFFFVLPAALLSGIMTPLHAMPEWLKVATLANPLRWYAELVRAVLLHGTGFAELMLQLAALLGLGLAILVLATLRFKRAHA